MYRHALALPYLFKHSSVSRTGDMIVTRMLHPHISVSVCVCVYVFVCVCVLTIEAIDLCDLPALVVPS